MARAIDLNFTRRSLWVCYLIISGLVNGQSAGRYHVANWQTDDGLPQNSVRAIAQTADGFLWLGTDNGLARFDGSEFTVFNQANHPELHSDHITKLIAGRGNRLWLVAGGALYSYHAGTFQRHPGLDRFSSHGIRALAQDRAGRLLIAAATGIYRVPPTGEVETLIVPNNNWPTENSYVAAPASGPAWVSHNNQLYQLTEDQFALRLSLKEAVTSLAVGDANEIYCGLSDGSVIRLRKDGETDRIAGKSPSVEGVLVDDRGNLWINAGALQIVPRDRSRQTIALSAGGADPRILALYSDRENSVWVGAEGNGVFRLRRQPLTVEAATRGRAITSVMQDAAGYLWLGTKAQGHLVGRDGRWSSGRIPGSAAALSLFQKSDRWIFLGSNGSGLWRLGGEVWNRVRGSRAQIVQALFEDHRGRVWIGSRNSGVEVLENERISKLPALEALDSKAVRCFAEDAANDIWIGTADGLYRLRESGLQRLSTADGLGANSVLSLRADSAGAVWIGTAGGGLTRHAANRLATLTTRRGLLDDVVAQILEDGHGNLWIGSNRGLFRMEKQKLNDALDGRARLVEGKSFGRTHGMLNLECTGGFQPNSAMAADGRLWFSTVDGAVVVDPDELSINPLTPPVHIQRVMLDGEEAAGDDHERGLLVSGLPNGVPTVAKTMTVPPGIRRLEIDYTGLSLAAPDEVRFKYRLAGYDDGWTDAGSRRTAYFTGVPPGEYQFQVMAANGDGLWNPNPASLGLSIQPALWQHPWFRGAAVLMFVAAAIGLHHARLRRLHQMQELRLRIARDLHDEVGANIGAISLLSGMGGAPVAGEPPNKNPLTEIHDIAQETAHSLREVVWFVTPEFDTVGDLAAHMETLARRLLADKRVNFHSTVGDPQRQLSLEFRRDVLSIFKEALHNIAKHSGAAEVTINIAVAGHSLNLQVEDNGRGFGPAAVGDSGNGQKNMQTRARNLRADFKVSSRSGDGTKVNLRARLA